MGPGTAQIPLWLLQRVITALSLGTGPSAVCAGSNSHLSLLLILLCVAVLFKHPHQQRLAQDMRGGSSLDVDFGESSASRS